MKRQQEEQDFEDIHQERKKKKISHDSEASNKEIQTISKPDKKFAINCHHEHIHDFPQFLKSQIDDKIPENQTIKIISIFAARNFFGDVDFLKLDSSFLKRLDLSCIVELDLSCNKLKNFPSGMEKLPKLEVLNLSSNKIEKIPETFAQNSSNPMLKELNLRHNFLGSVDCLKNCSSLTKLTLSCNKFTSLDGIESSASTLKTLFLFGNRFTFEEIIKKFKESSFDNLEELTLSGNTFSFAGYVQIPGFSPKSEPEVEEKIEELKKVLPNLKKIENICL